MQLRRKVEIDPEVPVFVETTGSNEVGVEVSYNHHLLLLLLPPTTNRTTTNNYNNKGALFADLNNVHFL